MDVAVDVAAGHDTRYITRGEGCRVARMRGHRGTARIDIVNDRMRAVGAEPVPWLRRNSATFASHLAHLPCCFARVRRHRYLIGRLIRILTQAHARLPARTGNRTGATFMPATPPACARGYSSQTEPSHSSGRRAGPH